MVSSIHLLSILAAIGSVLKWLVKRSQGVGECWKLTIVRQSAGPDHFCFQEQWLNCWFEWFDEVVEVEIVTGTEPMREFGPIVILLAALLYAPGVVQAGDHPAFEPVKELFAAMSAQDGKAMRATATEDFQLLEHGEEWSMQKLVDVVLANGKPHQRKNFFKQILARQSGDMAWVSYWNKAEIQRATGMRVIVWLESAVMVQIGDEWKIQMLHSTRLDPEKQPKNVQWVPLEQPSRVTK